MPTLSSTLTLKDKFSSSLKNAFKSTQQLNQGVSQTNSKLKILGHMTVRPVIKVKDQATATIGKVKNGLLSLNGIAGMALAGIGMHSLGSATIGSAMDFEQQMVSMEHWLKGNKALAKEATGWLENFANASPFTMEDLFPAMTRGIGVANGDVKVAERLLTLASDMAALTPGKTVGDAMEALADAQMGEFERMKEFGMKMTQEESKTLGGFLGVVKKAEGNFSDGAKKLGKTTRGQLSTISDTIGTMFRNVGTGILQSFGPRLDNVISWFDSHQDTVKRWKDNLITFGRQASEGIFSSLEGAFNHIRVTYLDNPEFQNLSITGKINFIMNDLGQAISSWLDSGGSSTLKTFGSKIGSVIGEGLTAVAPAMGRAFGDALVSGFGAALQSSFLGSIIVGAIGGGAVTLGNPLGFIAGAGAGAITWGTSEIANDAQRLRNSGTGLGANSKLGKPKGHASGLPYVPYDNYRANLHKGETVLTRAQADQYRKGSSSKIVHIANVTINGMNKTTKQIFDEIMDMAEEADRNMGDVIPAW